MRHALVTGAGTRLGQAIALELGKIGYDIAVHYNSSRSGAEETVAGLKAMGRNGIAIGVDLRDPETTDRLVADASEALGGPLNCLINNASLFIFDKMGTITAESWAENFDTNLIAPVFLTQKFAEQAPKANTGDDGERTAESLVINMLDQRVKKLTPGNMSYTLAKSALWTFTQTAAQALSPDIRVNAIGPGTTLPSPGQSNEHFRNQRSKNPLQRGPNIEDICAAVTYLEAAKSVSGQLITVDGGQHLSWETPDVLAARSPL